MDHTVDKDYRNKHFAEAWTKSAQASKPAAVAQESTTASIEGKPMEGKPLTTEQLIASFSSLSIEPAKPPIKGMPEPLCPIASLPEEILIHILQDVSKLDVGDFVRLSRVCKRFAWLVATENSVWRQVSSLSLISDLGNLPLGRTLANEGLGVSWAKIWLHRDALRFPIAVRLAAY